MPHLYGGLMAFVLKVKPHSYRSFPHVLGGLLPFVCMLLHQFPATGLYLSSSHYGSSIGDEYWME